MSMPHVVHPWSQPAPSFDLSTLTEMAAVTAASDPTPVAEALFSAGYVAAAIAVADSTGIPALLDRAAGWRQVVDADVALTTLVTRGGGALIPSVSVRSDGTPRFVITVPDADDAAAALRAEHGDRGVDAELRLFLDEALRSGDRYVDAAPGAGFAALSAASGQAAASVVVLCEDSAQCASIDASARWSDVAESVTAREGATLDQLALGPATAGASTILHAGSAAAVAPLLSSARGALERGDIGAVAWRCGRSDETGRDAENLQIAAAVLGVFGFVHFALADGANGPELVPAAVMASNEMIFSIEPGFLARFAE